VQNAKMRDAARRIEAQQKDIRRYELLENVLRYLREYGSDIHVTVRFTAASVAYHDQAAQVVQELYFNDWSETGRRETQAAVEKEMKEIEARLEG
jgi:hypothetical protein